MDVYIIKLIGFFAFIEHFQFNDSGMDSTDTYIDFQQPSTLLNNYAVY